MNDKLDYTIEFINKDFDLESDLFQDCGKGDQFYGRDVADYLVNELKAHCLEINCIEEDWGWQVFGKIKDEQRFDINIYPWGLLEEASGNEFHLWRLRLCVQQKAKFLGLLPLYKSVMCDDDFCRILKGKLSAGSFEFRRMEVGVIWN